MLRGQQTLFTNIFPASVLKMPSNGNQRIAMLSQRDNALASRYFYYAQIRRFRYDDCLSALEREFFISAAVIAQRLDTKRSFLKELVANEQTLKHLKSEYPQFSWVEKPL